MIRSRPHSLHYAIFGLILLLSGCGGSSSETPMPLEPVPHPATSIKGPDDKPSVDGETSASPAPEGEQEHE